jgi:hypothetical protein
MLVRLLWVHLSNLFHHPPKTQLPPLNPTQTLTQAACTSSLALTVALIFPVSNLSASSLFFRFFLFTLLNLLLNLPFFRFSFFTLTQNPESAYC